MYDMIENMELAAESAMDRLHISGTTIHCPACSEPFDYEQEGGTNSPNPYAIPMCDKCLSNYSKIFSKTRLII